MFFKFLKNIFHTTQVKKPVGRWIVNDKKDILRATWVNMDCCGDSLCGDPKKFREVRKRTVTR